MKIDFYGHTLELNDEIIEKHGKFAGYAYAETDEEYKKCLVNEISAAIRIVHHIRTNEYEILFKKYNNKQIVKTIEDRFLSELIETMAGNQEYMDIDHLNKKGKSGKDNGK